MSLRKKILLPIIVTLVIVLFIFSYLLYQIYKEHRFIEENILKVEKLNSLNSQLNDLQFKTYFNVLLYQADNDPVYIDRSAQATSQIAEVLDEMYPLIDSATGQELVKNYINSRKNVDKLRNDYFSAIRNNDPEQIQTNYIKWKIQADAIRATLADFETHNLYTSQRSLSVLRETGYWIAITIVLILGTILALVLFLYFYLDKIITRPVLKLTNDTQEISKANFLSMKINITTNDEIGMLSKNIRTMNLKLKRIYMNLEKKVRERTGALQEANERYQIVTNNFPNGGVALIDRNFCFLMVGGQEFSHPGITPESAVGKRVDEIYPKSIVKQLTRNFKKTLKGEETTSEARYRTQDYLVRNIPIKDNKGFVVSFISMAQNITHEKEIDQQKSAFIGIASHELKTPLTTLSAYVQMLENRLKKDKRNAYFISNVKSQTDRMVSLIDDLLNVSKIDSGKLDLQIQEFDLDLLVRKVLKDFQYMTQTHVIEKEGKVTSLIYGDEVRIEQVIVNLISNAIKYSPNAKKVVVRLSQARTNVTVMIQDFGMGISKEDQSRLFQRFYRTKDKAEGKVKGFGLGLYICSEIIMRHKGKIWVESELGKGSKFSFTLPLVKNADLS